MARAITGPELTKLRSDNQFSRLFLAIHNPAVVMIARINQTFVTTDMVIQITYDTASGSYTNVLAGQTIWIGSAAGLQDLGRVRVRLAPSATVFYIGETSDIAFADNLYLTVVDEFGLWPRHLRIDENLIPYMDWGIAYSNQYDTMAPVPVMGPPAVAWLTGATVTVGFDGSASYSLSGGLSSYSWAFPGSVSSTGLSTATPTATYNAAGTYRAALTVERSGVFTTGYRYVFVYSAAHLPVTQFELGSLSGKYETGGWEFDVKMWAEADISTVQPGAQVILFARDYYAGVEESLGPITGRENVIAVGWIDTEDLEINPVAGSVTFTVKGPHHWLGQMTGFPLGMENTTAAAATAWTNIPGLTVDNMLWQFLYWRSTACVCMDVLLTGDTRNASALEAPTGSLWQQLLVIAQETILAAPCCDRYARLFIAIDPQYIPAAGRSSIPNVMTISKVDWRDNLTVNRIPHSTTARVELSGVAIVNNTANSYFSLANGHTFKRYGAARQVERLLLSTQAQANTLAGLLLVKDNLPYSFDFGIAENNRFVDITPAQYVTAVIAPADNPRGVTYNDYAIVRSVTLNKQDQTLLWDWSAEQVTAETLNVDGDIPVTDAAGNFEISFKVPAFPPLPPLPALPLIPGNVGTVQSVWIATNVGIFYTQNFTDAAPKWVSANSGILPADLGSIKDLQVNKYGQALINVAPTGDGGQRLYYAPMGGQATRVQSTSLYFLVFAPRTPYFYTIASNPYQQNVFYFVIGDGAVTKIYSLDVTTNLAALVYDFASGTGGPVPPPFQSTGNLNYVGDSWIMTIGVGLFNSQYVIKMNTTLTAAQYISASLGGYGAGQSYSTPAAGTGDFQYYPALNSIITGRGSVLTALPAGVTMNNYPYGIAGDPTGQVIMLQNASGIGSATQKSINGGSSFSAVTFPIGGTHSAIQALDTQNFIWAMGSVSGAGNSSVFITTDQGATFIDKTGNLRAVAYPNFQPVAIKAVV
jgi:PKD repeat protein